MSVTFTKFKLDSTNVPLAKTKKGKVGKPPAHPIFAECAEIMSDEYWKKYLIKASKGRFPPKFSYSNSILTYSKGNKSESVKISENDPFQAANVFCQFLRIKGGLYGPNDINTNQYDEIEEEPITWGNSGKKCREILLGYFYDDVKKFLKLSDSETNQLKNVIRIGMVNKYFGTHNIIVQNNRIANINGLIWTPDNRRFSQDPNLVAVESRTSRKVNNNSEINKDTCPKFARLYIERIKYLEKKKSRLHKTKELSDEYSYGGAYSGNDSSIRNNSHTD